MLSQKQGRAIDRVFLPERQFITSILRKELRGVRSVLDLGCGDGLKQPLRDVRYKGYTVGVDVYADSVRKAKSLHTHTRFLRLDITKNWNRFRDKSFDAVTAFDLIEHLTKKEGSKLIWQAQRIARKKVIILTPNGYVSQDARLRRGNRWNKHRCGWSEEEFLQQGFRCIGAGGLKIGRGEKATIRFRPWTLGQLFANVSQAVLWRFSSLCYHLIAVKDL